MATSTTPQKPRAIMGPPAPPTPSTPSDPSRTTALIPGPSEGLTIFVREVTQVKSEMPSPPPTLRVKSERPATLPVPRSRPTPGPATPDRRQSSVTPRKKTPYKMPITPLSRYGRSSRTSSTFPRIQSRQATMSLRAPSATPTLAASVRSGSFIRGGTMDAPIDFESISEPSSPTPSRSRFDSVLGGTSEASFALSNRDHSVFDQSRPFAIPNQRPVRQGAERRQARQNSPITAPVNPSSMPSAMKEAVESACGILDRMFTVDLEADLAEASNAKVIITSNLVDILFSIPPKKKVTVSIGGEISPGSLAILFDLLKRHLKIVISGHERAYRMPQQKIKKSAAAVSVWMGMWQSGLVLDGADIVTLMTRDQAMEAIAAWSDALSGAAQGHITALSETLPALNEQNFRRWRHAAVDLAKAILSEVYKVSN